MTELSIADQAPPKFGIGPVIVVGFRALMHNLVPFLAVTFATGLLNYALTFGLQQAFLRPTTEPAPHVSAIGVITWLLGLAIGAFNQSALTFGTFEYLSGRPVVLRALLSRGLAVLPKAFVVNLLWVCGLVLCSVLLVVPGLIFATVFWLCIPAIAVEDAGIGSSFGRSRKLTKGNRWKIFALFLIVAVVFGIFEVVLVRSVGVENLVMMLQHVWIGVAMTLAGGLVIAYITVATTVAYYLLRNDKEGITSELAQVFA